MSNGASTPSAFKRVFVGDDASYAVRVDPNDLFQIAGPYGPILRVGSTPTEDYVIWTGTANTSFGEIDIGANLANYLTITGAATGSTPVIQMKGAVDADVGLTLTLKGNGIFTTRRQALAAATMNVAAGGTLRGIFSAATTTISGTITSGVASNFSHIVSNDVASATGAIGGNIYYMFGGYEFGGTGMTGGRIGHNISHNLNKGDTSNSPASNFFHIGSSIQASAAFSDGGILGNAAGELFGQFVSSELRAGAKHWNHVKGVEYNISIDQYGSAAYKSGITIGASTTDAEEAIIEESFIAIGAKKANATLSTGMRVGILYGGVGGFWGIPPYGSLIEAASTTVTGFGPPPPMSAAYGLEASLVTFGGAFLRSSNFVVDGGGNVGSLGATSGLTLQTRDGINARTATVTGINVLDGGTFTGFPTFTIAAPPTSGTTATAVVTTMGLRDLGTVPVAGSGYAVNDILTPTTGTGTAGTLRVTKVDGAGGVLSAHMETVGSYTVLPASPFAVTGGSGVGAQFTGLYQILTCTATLAGSNYPQYPAPLVDINASLQIRRAKLIPVMTGTQTNLRLNAGGTTNPDRILQQYTQTVSGALSSFIVANQTLNGNVTSGANVYPNIINVADGANTTGGGGPGALNYFTIIDSLSASATGGRNGILSIMTLNGAMTNASNALFYNAGSFDANASFNQGGTASGSGFAKLVGVTSEATARAGATYISTIEASEIGAGVRPGGSAHTVHVLRLSPVGYDGSRGGFSAYNGLVFGHGTSPGTDADGLDTGIGFGAVDGNLFPIARTGNIIEIQTPSTAPLNTVAWGVDFARGTFDGGAWRSPGFAISPIGTVGGVSVFGTAIQTQSTIRAASAVVGSIAVTNGGTFTAIPTLTISAPPLGGTTATATVASMRAARAFIDTQGSGYTNGDVLTLVGGTFSTSAQVTVTVVAGLITEIVVSRLGSYTVLPANAVSVTGGTGTGARFYLQWGVNAVTVTGAGTNYPTYPPPFIACSGEQSIKALFAVTMTETQQPLLLNAGSSVQVDTLTVNASGPTIRSGTGAASGTQPRGSVWMRTDGGVGTTMYVSQGGGTWNAVAGV
jgi:hypothetical protein